MSSIKYKNLLFYSTNAQDSQSQIFLAELNKNSQLKKQFILICVNDPNINIPERIKQIGRTPILITPGFDKPIVGEDVVNWIKNNGFQEKINGTNLDFGLLGSDTDNYAYLSDESKPSDYNQHHNHEYNRGFIDKGSILNNQFSKLSDNTHIATYDDPKNSKKGSSDGMSKSLDQLKQQRDADLPQSNKRIGGLEDFKIGNTNTNAPTNPSYNTTANAPPSYNANPNPNWMQGNAPRLPFNTSFNTNKQFNPNF